MELDWYYAGNDAAAIHDNLVFRIHKKAIPHKLASHLDKEDFFVYQLEVREKNKTQFKPLGYTFYTVHQASYGALGLIESYSVDEKLWGSLENIIERAEEILMILGFLPDYTENL